MSSHGGRTSTTPRTPLATTKQVKALGRRLFDSALDSGDVDLALMCMHSPGAVLEQPKWYHVALLERVASLDWEVA